MPKKVSKTEVRLNVDLQNAVDALYAQREQRLGLQHRVDEMKEHEDGLVADVTRLLNAAKLDGIKTDTASVAFRRLQVPQLTDDDAFLNWGRQKANRDVLKVGVNAEAWRLRLADGQAVPGVESFLRESLAVKGRG